MSIQNLISWSQKEFPSLPWRQNRSLYRTLVSEIMLQQTTVSTVKNHYERFLKTFPDLKSLALASEDELVVAWKGLGYYRRARSLKKIAEAIQNEHGGKFPQDAVSLMEISGIGPYTSQALLGIGMDQRALAVDANLERVIARFYGLKFEKGLKLQKEIAALFNKGKVFPQKDLSYRALNEALMDLGRTICQARKASCELCPLRKECVALKKGEALKYPVVKAEAPKKKQDHELHLLRVYVMKGKKLLVYKKEEKEWLSGQFEVPTFILKTTDKTLKQYPHLTSENDLPIKASFKSGITKYAITNSIVLLNEKAFKKLSFARSLEWREVDHDQANLSTATSKGLARIYT